MSWLRQAFGGGDAAGAANQYLNQIPGVAHQGYDPYVNAGQDASGKTKTKYEELMENPTEFINQLMKGYQPSEGYQFQKDQLTKELGNTAAARGIAGTPYDQMQQGQGVQKLLSGDMQQFLQNALGVFNTGLTGEEGVATRGYDASGKLTDAVGSNLNQQGSLAFNNAQNNQKSKQDMWKMFIQALGGIGGLATGNPAGAIAGPLSGSSNAPWNNPG
jgi:hypothetical protein